MNRVKQIGGAMPPRTRLIALALACCVWCLSAGAPSALALPRWELASMSNTTVAPGDTLSYAVSLYNHGDTVTDGSDASLTVTLPPGITAVSAQSEGGFTCPPVAGAQEFACTTTAVPDNSQPYKMAVLAQVDPAAHGVLTTRMVLGGGGALEAAQTVDPVRVTTDPVAFGVDAFDGMATDADGTPFTQAGGHPASLTTSMDFNTHDDPNAVGGPRRLIEDPRDVEVGLPPGLVGSPVGVATCTVGQLANGVGLDDRPLCPTTSQVGLVTVRLGGGSAAVTYTSPVYNMAVPPGVPARFGFQLLRVLFALDAGVRSSGDYGLRVRAANVAQTLNVVGTTFTFWGVPADASHDGERSCPGRSTPFLGGPSCPNGASPKAFFRTPTSCTAPGVGVPTTLRMDSWQNPGVFQEASFLSHEPLGYPYAPQDWGAQVGTTGCDAVPFTPSFDAQPPQGAKANSPSAMAFDLAIPQDEDPGSIGQADLRKAVVTFPEGLTVSPSSAGGLEGCSSAQIALKSEALPSCPPASKLGTVRIDTPLLDVPVEGHVYLAKPHDNPFDALVAVYLVASAKGVVLKLPGKADLDPVTGRITATFDDNPQLPFSNLHLQFNGGSRAPFALPAACGRYAVRSVMTGWNGKDASVESPFELGGDCGPRTFAPAVSAGTENPVAAASSPFRFRLTRTDQDNELGAVRTTLPAGLLAHIGDVTPCADAAASAGTCGPESLIGSATSGAGVGPDPFYITSGRVYLTGPYKGAPFGLAVVVPAVAGPFDLGTVVVRGSLGIDPVTARATVQTDPLPTILQGIPLKLRDVRLDVDRPGFMVNPTSCAEKRIDVTVGSTAGDTASIGDRFQVGDCAALALKPKLKLALTGRGQTTDGKHPGVSATLTQRPGQANLRKVKVTLPLSLALDVDNANGLCEFEPGSRPLPECPAASVVGSATAVTPLLKEPLTGPVYFVKNRRVNKAGREVATLPKIVMALRGTNGLRLTVTGTSAVDKRNRLVTTFARIPDAPVTSFRLKIAGGRHGILVVSGRNVCRGKQRALQAIDGQNGKIADATVTMATPCRKRR